MYEKLLVPIGPEVTSNTAALDEATNFAAELGSDIQLLYVWTNTKDKEKFENSDEEYPEPIAHALNYIDDKFNTEYHIESGNAADEIVDKADEIGVNAIVMGTNAATGVKRMVLGSITERVIRKSKLPVVAVNYHGE